MYIQQIEIDNFKSFANKTVIPFQEGFTTISGPNGSGKSNIIDSILFCLGLSSSRTMRAEKLTDLINNAARRREAQVTIMFGNTDAPDDEKIIIARKIKDSGQSGYTSTYYLNGKVSTLSEIHDRLSQHHISPGAYNVLMQGDVTGIINMTPLERRKIIDEIAGVAEFDRKIDQARKELESVSGSIERFTLLLGELEGRVQQLAQEREQALKYQKLKDEKQRFEDMLLTSRYLDLKKSFQAAEQNIVASRKQKTQAQQNMAALEAQIAKTREALTQLTNEVKRKGEDQQIALTRQIEGLKGAIHRKKDTIQFSGKKRQENLRAIERAQDEVTRLTAKIDDLNTAIEGFKHQEKEVRDRLGREQTLLETHQAKLSGLLDSTGALGEQRNKLREEVRQGEDQLAAMNRRKLDMESELDRQYKEKTYHQERLSSQGDRHADVLSEKASLEKALAEADLERQAFEKQIQNQQLEVSKLRVALNDATAAMNRLHREYAQLDAQKRAYEEVNFGRSIDTVLNAGLDGVHGTLSQLCSVEGEFGLATEIALGGRLKSIVVDNDRVAEEAINLLQRSKAGRATFLPLNKMREAGYLPLLPTDDGIIDYAINLVSFDSRYQDVFAYALGDTVIVEDISVARRYLRKFRMVTLDGSLFEKTGAITGGSSQSQGMGGKLGNAKLDQQLKELREQLETQDEARDKLEKRLTSAEIRLDALKSDYAEYLGDLQKKQLTLDSLTRELKQLTPADSYQEALSRIEDKVAALQSEHEALEKSITASEHQLAAHREALEQIDAQLPTEQMEQLKTEMEHIEFQIRSYEAQIRNIQGDIQSKQLEKEFQEKGIQSYHEQVEQLKTGNLAIDKEKQDLLEEITLLEKQIVDLEVQAGELNEELKQLQAERDAVQAQLIQEEQQKYTITRELSLIDEQILAYQTRKRELQPEIEAVRLELTEAGLDPDALQTENIPDAEEVHRNIARLNRQMEGMGLVNMRAIQDYDEVMARHQELTEKINTLTREREDLGIKITGYSELKLHAFMTAFNNVDENFKEIFAELSDGEGRLILTNPDDPFNGGLTIEARPRGKKMQRMESMSGGEKSLTALAFVFSFQRYMPAPFYAFDEVDMFLDGINAEKLAHMVKKQSGAAQFIVVSLRKPMLQHSDRTVGVTQKRDGISKVTGVLLQHAS